VRALGRTVEAYLDVGCGTGRFLRAMHGRGVPRAQCHGLDLDAATLRPLHAEGFSTHIGRVEECEAIAAGSLDLVTMFHVIEHVADPGAVLARVFGWLRPGGLLALETPNLASWDARLFGASYWGGYHIPRHFHVFTPGSLERLATERGFACDAVEWQTGHAFWMYSLHHLLRYGQRPRPALARAFDPFRSLPLLVAFTALDKARGALGVPTSSMLALLRRPTLPATATAA
jgi:SAM-dependent methyltransferase